MENPVVFDLAEIKVNHHSNSGMVFLSNSYLSYILIVDQEHFFMKEGIELSLIDIDINSIGFFKLIKAVLTKLTNIDYNSSVGGVGKRSEIINFNPRVTPAKANGLKKKNNNNANGNLLERKV